MKRARARSPYPLLASGSLANALMFRAAVERQAVANAADAARAKGGATTAKARAQVAEARRTHIIAVALEVLKTAPDTKVEGLAADLHDRGLGGKEALRKMLIRAGF